jgi:hypothetical protein
MPDASAGLRWAFVALALLVALGFILVVRRAWLATGVGAAGLRRATTIAAALTTAWLGGTGLLAASGLLRFDGRPPTMPFLFVAILALGVGLGASPVGARLAAGLPLALLVGSQAFRIAVELLIHQAGAEGIAPPQMTWEGRNLDVVTGVTALLLGAWLARRPAPRWLVHAWNVLGFALLANVVTVGWLSTPTPMRRFWNEPANVWIAHAPWVWLPTVMVLAALLGHVLVFRKLRAAARRRPGPPVRGHQPTAPR